MNLNLFNLDKDKSVLNNKDSNFIYSFMSELKEYLNSPKNNLFLKDDLYTVTSVFSNDVRLQNKRTGELYDVPKGNLPEGTERFNIIKIEKGKYIRDYETEDRISEELGEKANNSLTGDRLLRDLNKSRAKFHYIVSENISNTVSDVKSFLNNPKNNTSLKNDIYVIDRFEGDRTVYAVCQNSRTGKMYDIPKIDLPKEVQEGSAIKIVNNKYVLN